MASTNCNQQPSVIITGMGIICSIANEVSTFSNALRTGKRNFCKSERFPQLAFPVIAAELNDFNFEHSLHKYADTQSNFVKKIKSIGQRAPISIQTALITALEAWDHAKLSTRLTDNRRIGVVIAGQNISQAYQFNMYSTFSNKPDYLPPSYALHFMDTDLVGSVSEAFDIQGEGFTVGGASASGNMGIIHAYRLITQGLLDACLVIGTLADLSSMELQGFYNAGALGGQRNGYSPEEACRPFDQNRDGFIWGQSCGCLILESSKHAQLNQTESLGEILGTAIVLNAQRSAHPSKTGECHAMQQAIKNAQINAQAINYINTHGTASLVGDEVEIAAIQEIFGDHTKNIWLNSTKGHIGHGLWSAGVVEAIATVLQLQNNFVHANANLVNPISKHCKFVGQFSEEATINTALSNSFGFGGINTSIIISKTLT